jgi:hypothetical protein
MEQKSTGPIAAPEWAVADCIGTAAAALDALPLDATVIDESLVSTGRGARLW